MYRTKALTAASRVLRVVSPLPLQVREEVEHQRGVELLKGEMGRPHVEALAGEGKHQPEGVGVGVSHV